MRTLISLAILAAAALGQAQTTLHLHVDGDGLFRFSRMGKAVYSPDATLTCTSGVLVSKEGYPLLPQIHVPTTGAGVRCAMDGTVTIGGKPGGRIVLVSFGSARLTKSNGYFLGTTGASIGCPGEGVFGVIRATDLESRATPNGLRASGNGQRATGSVGPGTTRIEFKLRAETEKSDILLGDIATISGPDSQRHPLEEIDLGTTPIFGAWRGISEAYVRARIRSIGLDADKIEIVCPAGATVIRKGQKVDEDTLVQAAVDAAKKKLGLTYDLRADRSTGDFWAPVGELKIEPKEISQTGDGAMVNLEIDVDGQMAARKTVSLVPTTPLPKVNIGDPVKVEITRNGAIVTVDGRVRTAARVGLTITVETEAGAVFTGTLKSTSLVEVQL